MSFEESVKILRDKFPDQYLTKGHEFEGMCIFTLVSKKYREFAFPTAMPPIAVTKEGDIINFNPLVNVSPDKRNSYRVSSNNIIKVDDDEVDIDFIKKKGMESLFGK